MKKGKISIYNAIFSVLNTLISSIFALVLGKCILTFYGSDYNGINSTITQIVSAIMLLEGGFTLASNVALFEPFERNDIEKINGILSATSKRFAVVGAVSLVVGIIVTVIYPLTINNTISKWTIGMMLLTVLIPACINLGFNMRYRVLLLTSQKEYIISIFSTVTYVMGNGVAICLALLGSGILSVRIVIMLSMLLGYVLIAIYCRVKFPYVDFRQKPLFNEIKGTKNVLVTKILAVVYSSVPMIIISMIPETGLVLASVYSVYKNVVYTVKNVLTSVCNAPRLSFGALLASGETARVKKLFEQYELIVCISISVILGTTCLLLLPFVQLYTNGITDVSYINIPIACIVLLTAFVEIIHIPSGQIIQMSGNFLATRKIQTVSLIVLAVSMAFGWIFGGMIGVTLSVLLAALLLAVLEIFYAGAKILHRKPSDFIKNILPCMIIIVITMIIGLSGVIPCNSIMTFVICGFLFVVALGAITAFIYSITKRKELKEVFAIIKGMFLRYR